MLSKLKAEGAVEPLYYDGDSVRETVRANVFFVTREDQIITPARKILLGITRKKTLEIARQHFEVEEREIRLQEIWESKEAFLSSSTRKLMPIVNIDGRLIGTGKPGIITGELNSLLAEYTERYLERSVQIAGM